MHDAQEVVALNDRVHNEPHRVDVVDLVKGPALHIHLAVDAVDALDPAFQVDALQPFLL